MGVDPGPRRPQSKAGEVVEILPAPLPGRPRPSSFKMISYRGHDSIVRTICEGGWGCFEAPLPDVFSLCVLSGATTILDVGASSGFYSLLAASVRSDATAHAFEPYGPAGELCVRNVAVNAAEARIILQHVAVTRFCGVATLYVPSGDDETMETSASLDPNFRSCHSEWLVVETVTIDAYVERNALSRVDVVKIDVESAEYDVLLGGEKTISRDRPLIFCEILEGAAHSGLDAFCSRCHLIDIRLRKQAVIVGDRITFDPEAWNHMLVPAERIGPVMGLLESLGIQPS